MNKGIKILLAAALAVTTSSAAMAGKGSSYICAYVNDNLYGPNAAEGYKIGPGDATIHVGPYTTNGNGRNGGPYAGGLGATRVRQGDLYVSDGASDNITHFTINKRDCTLTVDAILYPSGDTGVLNGDVLAITPDGRTMFVSATGDQHIYSHTIAANGSLGATFTEASTPNVQALGIEVTPDGQTLVVSYDTPRHGRVCAYPISKGHLGTPNCKPTATSPAGVSIDRDSACVYVGEGTLSVSAVAAFTLTGGILGAATQYNPFGPGANSQAVLVDWDNKAIYVSNQQSAQVTVGAIRPGCKLSYKAIISDGISGSDSPGQIAQAKIAHGYVVNGNFNTNRMPNMGIFRAHANGKLTPIGSGQFPLMSGSGPETVVVIGSN
jgi:6-phosphogluconolactonase (cycloisomerase 2 family)